MKKRLARERLKFRRGPWQAHVTENMEVGDFQGRGPSSSFAGGRGVVVLEQRKTTEKWI